MTPQWWLVWYASLAVTVLVLCAVFWSGAVPMECMAVGFHGAEACQEAARGVE